MKHYDMLIIGAGSGGITVGVTAAGLGKKVLIVERNKPGGECTWSGCVPSKTLINEAKKIHVVRQHLPNFTYDTKTALDKVKEVRETVYKHEDPSTLQKMGIEYLHGKAQFNGKGHVEIQLEEGGTEEISAKKIVIATGSAPFVPPISGLDMVSYLTNESIFELERFPSSMIVLGGGAIGVELAQALNRLGIKVQLVEMMETILFREEMDLVLPLQKALGDEGIEFYLGAKATNVKQSGKNYTLTYEKNGRSDSINAESILVAVGRKPNIDGLQLELAGIQFDRRGIQVNAQMETSCPGTYAIGDVVGPYQFSHMANAQGIRAALNAILPFKQAMNYKHVAWVTFTEPELARAGYTEAEARERFGNSILVYNFDMNDIDRTRTKGASIERIKLILDKKGKLLGASILADRAGEMISEIQVIKNFGIPYGKISDIIHPYPTYGEAFQKIAKRVRVDRIVNNPIVKLVRGSQ